MTNERIQIGDFIQPNHFWKLLASESESINGPFLVLDIVGTGLMKILSADAKIFWSYDQSWTKYEEDAGLNL